MTRDDVVRMLDLYLEKGWTIHAVKGGSGSDWQDMRIELRRPADHSYREVIGGANGPS